MALLQNPRGPHYTSHYSLRYYWYLLSTRSAGSHDPSGRTNCTISCPSTVSFSAMNWMQSWQPFLSPSTGVEAMFLDVKCVASRTQRGLPDVISPFFLLCAYLCVCVCICLLLWRGYFSMDLNTGLLPSPRIPVIFCLTCPIIMISLMK